MGAGFAQLLAAQGEPAGVHDDATVETDGADVPRPTADDGVGQPAPTPGAVPDPDDDPDGDEDEITPGALAPQAPSPTVDAPSSDPPLVPVGSMDPVTPDSPFANPSGPPTRPMEPLTPMDPVRPDSPFANPSGPPTRPMEPLAPMDPVTPDSPFAKRDVQATTADGPSGSEPAASRASDQHAGDVARRLAALEEMAPPRASGEPGRSGAAGPVPGHQPAADAAVAAARRALTAALRGEQATGPVEARDVPAPSRGEGSRVPHESRYSPLMPRFEAADSAGGEPSRGDASGQAGGRQSAGVAAALDLALRRAGLGADDGASLGFERVVRQAASSTVLAGPAAGSAAQGAFPQATLWPETFVMPGQPLSQAGAGSLGQPELPEQIVRAIRLHWTQGISEARVRLQPQHLGDVTIALRVEHGAVRADLHADSVEVRNMIRGNEAELRRTLSEQGLQLSRLTVNEEPDHRAPQQDRDGGAPGHRRRPRPQAGPRFDELV